MRVVAILGSPRKNGNSSSLAQIILDKVVDQGANPEVYSLNSLNFKGCQGCSACKGKSEKCVVNDDLAMVLQSVIDCDLLILATPVYWGDISGQMKLFVDRTYSFLKPDFKDREDKHRLPPGKKLVWIESQGAENEELFKDVFERYNNFFQQLKYFEETHYIRACGMSAGVTLAQRPDLIEEAEKVASQFC